MPAALKAGRRYRATHGMLKDPPPPHGKTGRSKRRTKCGIETWQSSKQSAAGLAPTGEVALYSAPPDLPPS